MGTLRDPGLRLIDRAEYGDHALMEAATGIGENDLPRGALQKSRPEPLFQPFDALGDDRW